MAGLTEVAYFGVKPHAKRHGDLPVWRNAGDLRLGRHTWLGYFSVKTHAIRDNDVPVWRSAGDLWRGRQTRILCRKTPRKTTW